MLVEVDDPDDPRLADYVRLNDPALRRRVERTGGYFIAEGDLVIRELLRQPRWPLRSLLLTPARHAALADVAPLDAPVYVAPLEVLRRVAGFDVHRGALASAARLPLDPVADVLCDARLVLVLEDVNDHENVGSIFRSAAAFGVDAVVLDDRAADPLYRRSLRVSVGNVLRVPFTRVHSTREVAAAGFTTAALTPAPDAEPLAALVADCPPRLALLLGSEGPGLSDATLSSADRRVRIPIHPEVDSLNVAVAAAVALSHLRP